MNSQLRLYVIAACLCLTSNVSSQSSRVLLDTSYIKSDHMELLTEENIDFYSNGFIRSTTNIFKFNIGNPDKFYLPFYLLLGTTADVVSTDRFVNEEMAFDMLNSNGGLINAGYKLSVPLSEPEQYSQFFLMHQLSAKSITGILFESGEKKSFLSYMGNIGLMLQVKAWNPDDSNNKGQFWLLTSASISKNPKEEIQNLFASTINPFFYAVHIESGITLSEGINIKGGYYRFINNQQVGGLDRGQFKLTGIYDL